MMTTIERELNTRVRGKSGQAKWLGEGVRQTLLFPALKMYTPLTIKGVENLKGEQPFIFVANHASHLDAPLLLEALPIHLRVRGRVAAAADYFFNRPWKGLLVSTVLNAFPLVRKGIGCLNSLAQVQELLRNGQSLVVFPEGTRTVDGNLQPFKRGIARLAMTRGVQVVPVWIEGTHAALPKGSHWPHHQAVSITFGTPLSFAPGSNAAHVTAEIEQSVQNLAPHCVALPEKVCM